MRIGRPPRNPVERFWEKVHLGEEGECWLWAGNKSNSGYGHFHVGATSRFQAHRYSYELVKGKIPAGLIVRHICDVPLCVNPAHLLVGTNAENSQDMVQRGRSLKGDLNPGRHFKQFGDSNPARRFPERLARGNSHPGTKFDEWDVRFIRLWRQKGASLKALSDLFRVSKFCISSIARGRTWGHIS